MITTVIQVGSAAIASAILVKALEASNRVDLAEWVRIATMALIGTFTAVKLIELINTLALLGT